MADFIDQAARYLCDCRRHNTLIGPLPGAAQRPLRPLSETDGYAIQTALHQKLSALLGPVSGHKIGCTTPVMQQYLNINQPCAGGIFLSTVHHRAGQIAAPQRGRIGVECELAVKLGAALPAENAPYDRASVRPAIAACMAALEIVADRYQNYTQLGVNTLIADDFFNAGCVLGAPVAAWQGLDLAALEGQMWINGELRGRGHSVDILGHPLNALAWIANRYAELKRPLMAGEFVLLGSVVQTQWLAACDQVRVSLTALGEVSLTVE